VDPGARSADNPAVPNPGRLPAVLLLAAAASAAAAGACGSERAERRNLLVVTIDTLRRDAVGFHGGPATPTLDALAAEALVCEDALTVAPVTLPAHASLFTGLYPASHGARDNGPMRVPAGVTTLAERLRARGWRTLASVSAFVLDPAFGIDQGFERYDAPSRPSGGVTVNVPQLRANEAVDRLLTGLDAVEDGEPWFAWLHLYDPHAPYDAPGAPRGLGDREAYLAEVRYADRELGRLVAELRRRGVWDDLVVVVASDHGEGLDDGREPTHGYSIHQTTMRIPLLIRDPRRPAGRWPHPVSLVDVAPTVLRMLEVSVGTDELDGEAIGSAGPGDGAERPAARTLLLESYLPWISHGWAPFEGAVRGELKVVRSHAHEAYDRAADPGERDDLAAGGDAPERFAPLFRELEERMAALPGRFQGEEVGGGSETAALLQSLGYAGAGEVVGTGERPDFDALASVVAKRPLIDRMDALAEALALGRTAEAVAELRALVALDPQNAQFLERLGETLVYADAEANAAEAERVLERAIALRPGRARAHLALATCALVQGDVARAEREVRAVLALEADQPSALRNLAFLLAQRARAATDPAARRAAAAESVELLDRLQPQLAADDPARAELGRQRADLARLAGLE
jgi:arylsulfatase A-like enzyme